MRDPQVTLTNGMVAQVHLAAQYLATASKSFLEHRADDSHTNLGYNTGERRLETWELDQNGTQLAFSFPDFSLQWLGDITTALSLDGKSHAEIVDWLLKTAEHHKLNGTYSYDLHYELPYPVEDHFKFQVSDPKGLDQLAGLRTLAHEVLASFLKKSYPNANIRIWPHHLDTGAFLALKNSDNAIGLGMAIPDNLVNEHYFYISGYSGNDSVAPTGFSPLTQGEWRNEGFKGAILPASNCTIPRGVAFFQEALKAYLTSFE
ncbi:MAG: hypothetical protein AAF717_16745 [Bacteroidota bacterium]